MAQKHTEYTEQPMTRAGTIQGPSRRYRRLRHPNFPAAEWATKNPLLQRGEIGIEIDTNRMKVGDGYTLWNDLPYAAETVATWGSIGGDINDQADLINMVDGKVAAEATARENADNTLQGNIDTVATNLGIETTARQNADTALGTRIDNEITARTNADTALQNQITTNKGTMDAHIANTSNPHQVTKAQVGLGNVDNTADLDKPISTATQTALDGKQNVSTANYQMGNASGGWTAMTNAQQDALNSGATTTNISQIATNTSTIAGHMADTNNPHSVTKTQVGLGNVDNTSDLNKPISTATQTALDGKQAKSASAYNMGNASGGWTAMTAAQQNALNSGATTTNIGQIATNTTNIANEIIDRQNADNGLQTQIDAIVSKSDVVDIVGTYAELQAYDTSSLGNNDVVKVLDDSTHNDAQSYYRWVITGGVGAWVYIGSEAETYTKAETDALLNDKQDVITDLATIRAGAALGATALQPGDNVSELVNDAGYLTQHQTLADLGITATAAEINVLDGITASTSELNYVDGVTSSIQTQLNGKQATISDLSTIRSGAAAGATAVQPGDLATVATSGSYNDLSNKPTIPAAQVNSDWNANSGVAQILNKPTLATVATSGSYNDLSNKPTIPTATSDLINDSGFITSSDIPVTDVTVGGTSVVSSGVAAVPAIPTVNNSTITITQGGVTKGSFTLNQASGETIDLDAGGGGSSTLAGLSDVTITSAASGQALMYDGSRWVNSMPSSAHNVGDVFWTMRTDSALNGAVECNGGTYDTGDYIGAESIGNLLTNGKVPYVSLSQYATLLSTNGSVGVFGWDGAGTTAFRVPSLNDIFIETGTAAQVGDYIPAGVPNLTGEFLPYAGRGAIFQGSGTASGVFKRGSAVTGTPQTASSGNGNALLFDANSSSSVYKNDVSTVQPNTVRYRAMVQLVTSATDTAVATCTAVTSQVAANTSALNGADYVVEKQDPSAGNNYTWYRKYKSGWVEQGGLVDLPAATNAGSLVTISFSVVMANSSYYFSPTMLQTRITGGSWYGWQIDSTTTTNISLRGYNTNARSGTSWEVKGMAA